ncbi:hypothetical protein GOODEAATRI_031314 [Goodea atripinnis]|uniref:Uncharacterized protein n=1 Tax=Goodea atripinnis TaxID=208336 RepID=A0ABV0NRA2_9TELE
MCVDLKHQELHALHVASGASPNIPDFNMSCITGLIPSSASGFKGYWRTNGLFSDICLTLYGGNPFISPTSVDDWDHSSGEIAARAGCMLLSLLSAKACICPSASSKCVLGWTLTVHPRMSFQISVLGSTFDSVSAVPAEV